MAVQKSDTTVIVTTYNDSVFDLSRALNSVLNQSLSPKEIIIIDDGSSNNTSEIALKEITIKSTIPIFLFKKTNGGPSSARNYGLKKCSSIYVTFLDSDDEMLPDNISIKEEKIKQLDMSYFGVYGTHITNSNNSFNYRDNDGILNTDLIGRKNGLPGGVHTYLFRTNYLLSIDGFDEFLVNHEDFDLIIRLTKKNLKAKGNLGPGFIKNYRSGSVSRNDKHLITYSHIQRFLKKAESNKYFSANELNKRKAGTELWLGRRLLKSPSNKKLAIKHLNQAFTYAKPEGLRQYIIYIIAKIGNSALKVSNKNQDQ